MKDINKMRLGILRELKNVHKFFDYMEKTVKSKNPDAVQKAYIFLMHLVYDMDKGHLSPDNIKLDLELAQIMQEEYPDLE